MADGGEDDGKSGEDFKWGAKAGVGKENKEIQTYESFTYRGITYGMYDCVHVYHEECTESFIGKIVKMWTVDDEKKVKLVWFFRPLEIRSFLGDYKLLWNEIFLASGLGKGISNTISPKLRESGRAIKESIMRKCNVVCTSEDERNSQATKEELETAEFVFSCTFDVAQRQIMKCLPDHIIFIKVENFLNKREEQNTSSGIVKPKMHVLCRGLGASSKENNHSLIVGKSARTSLIPRGDLCAKRCFSSEGSPLRPKSSVPHDGGGPGKTPLIQAIDKVNVKLPISSLSLRAEQTNSVPRDGDGPGKTPLIQAIDKVNVNLTMSSSILRAEQKISMLHDGDGPGKIQLTQAVDKVNVSLPIGSSILRAEQTSSVNCDGDGHSKTPHDQAMNRLKVSFRVGSSILRDKLKNSVPCDRDGHSNTHNQVINQVKVGLPKGSSTGQDEPMNSVPHDGDGRSNTAHNQAINQAKLSLQRVSMICRDKSEEPSSKKRKFVLDDYGRHNSGTAQTEEDRTERQIVQRRSWFKALSLEENLQAADGAGTLVMFENLDPSFSSSEVKDLVWRAFNERVEAKMLQRTSFSNPYSGEAFVIFKSKDAANAAITKLQDKCLILSGGRVLIARAAKLPNHSKAKTLTGHHKKNNLRVSKEMRGSVSTSHCAQPNNIEYELALDWEVQHERSEFCWRKLRQRQKEETDELRKTLKNVELDK